MLPERILYYGRPEPPPDRIALTAGPLTLVWEEGDLRTIKLGENEILRRIYIAIRDQNWVTVPNRLSNLQMDVQDDAFTITFDAANQNGDVDFTWQGRLTGSPAGVVTYVMDGVANRDFRKNRIGFCVLPPASAAGSTCRIVHVDGSEDTAQLPVLFRADQPVIPFAEMAAVSREVAPGLWFELRFAGDIFEMEDQRNWTDASYKIFSTPLRLPYPAAVHAGDKIVQSLQMRLVDQRAAAPAPARQPASAAKVELSFAPAAATAPVQLPALGLGTASSPHALSSLELDRLHRLALQHLRVDIWPSSGDAEAALMRASQQARALGIGLHVAVFLSERIDTDLHALAQLLELVRPPVAAWLVFPAVEALWGGSPTAKVLATARPLLKQAADVPLGSGTDADFIFLQRNVPPSELIDFLAYAIHPQTHAFDNLSLVETLACQGDQVCSAANLAPGRPLYVSPITLKARRNAYAMGAEPPTPPGQLPPQVDVRQMSLLGAGWTLGSIKYLAENGAASLTYFETAGWRGVMETAAGAPEPDLFRSLPGAVFPLYHVLADVGEFAGGQIVPSRSSAPLAVDGMILRRGPAQAILLANLSGQAQPVRLPHLSDTASVRLLEAANAEAAMRDPEGFRQQPGRPLPDAADGLLLVLPPYAYARVDLS